MFKIKLTARARKELKDISKRHNESLSLIFDEIKDYPLVGKPLKREFTGKFSYKVGVYRIVYQINFKDKVVLIVTAGHRSIVYN